VVSRDVAARTVVAGNPARLVRELPVEGESQRGL
jgi:acetyltransferase-like isoleucine patch superfamily enzyme